jgi:hypothetical protein
MDGNSLRAGIVSDCHYSEWVRGRNFQFFLFQLFGKQRNDNNAGHKGHIQHYDYGNRIKRHHIACS